MTSYRDRSKESIAKQERNRARALEYLGGVCVRCGYDRNLHFDHIDPSTKLFNVASRFQRAFTSIIPEIEKCQLLCQDCHIIKTRENKEYSKKEVPHGGGRSGKRHCQCELCREAKSHFYRVRNLLGRLPTDEELNYYDALWYG